MFSKRFSELRKEEMMPSSVNVKVGWDSTTIVIDGNLTKVCYPIGCNLSLNIPPSILSTLESGFQAGVKLEAAAAEYVRLLSTNGTIEDFESFCGGLATQHLKKLKEMYKSHSNESLPTLSRRARIEYDLPSVFAADNILKELANDRKQSEARRTESTLDLGGISQESQA
jgi:hypothetical protein